MRYSLLALILFSASFLFSQSLYEPIDWIDAIENGTRSRDGKPGPKYWQNKSIYQLNAKLYPDQNRLEGEATITYQNNSPEALSNITLRFYQDRYKKGGVRNIAIDPEDITDGVEIKELTLNGIEFIQDGNKVGGQRFNRKGTNLNLQLSPALASQQEATITIKWAYTFPSKTLERRTGGFRDGSYFVGLWYPQVAVFDDIKGWDNILSHRGIQEFYNDFCDFDVQIEVPEGYLVWATGDLQNPEEIYTDAILERLKKAQTGDEIIDIVEAVDYLSAITKSNKFHFKATNVPDFAFGAAKNFNWRGSSVEVEPGRRVFVDVAYHPNVTSYRSATETARDAVAFFSSDFPGVPFPYSHATTFTGIETNGPSMEFPMIANDAVYSNLIMMKLAVPHEIMHNYFPFYMGINEKHATWMDEGWAFFGETKFSEKSLGRSFIPYGYLYSQEVGRSDDFPLFTTSRNWLEENANLHYLAKPYLTYKLLENYLGEEPFKAAIQEYMRRWAGKHPTPHDFFYAINDASGQDLNWFWQPYFFEFGYPDLGIEQVEGAAITIQKTGVMPLPVRLEVNYDDDSKEYLNADIGVWKNGESSIVIRANEEKTIKSLKLSNTSFLDIRKQNDVYPKK